MVNNMKMREYERVRQYNQYQTWILSEKYSRKLKENISKSNISLMIKEYYVKFMRDIKSRNYKLTKKQKNAWDMVMNTLRRNKKNQDIKNAIHLLHYVSYKNI
jgi:hypothetical protein